MGWEEGADLTSLKVLYMVCARKDGGMPTMGETRAQDGSGHVAAGMCVIGAVGGAVAYEVPCCVGDPLC